MNPWRAGCVETRTSGSEGGPRKRTDGNVGTAPRSDPYTYASTGQGWLYVAFVLDVYSRAIVGWQITDHLRTDLVLDALEMAIWRRDLTAGGLIHHSDAGSQLRLKGWSQHRPVQRSVDVLRGSLLGFSIRGSCVGGC